MWTVVWVSECACCGPCPSRRPGRGRHRPDQRPHPIGRRTPRPAADAAVRPDPRPDPVRPGRGRRVLRRGRRRRPQHLHGPVVLRTAGPAPTRTRLLPTRRSRHLLPAHRRLPPRAPRALPDPAAVHLDQGELSHVRPGFLGDALAMAGSMPWQIAWSLIFGFTLSAVVRAVVRREAITRMLGDDRPATLAKATGLGIASSSCSYAAVALARSLFRKGAGFTSAMVFEIASTNLVVELGILLALLMGWQFTAAEFIGGPIMIVLVALMFRVFLRRRLVRAAREQADKGVAGSMEGHAAMDMSVTGEGSFWRRLTSARGYTAVSHIFVMEWAAIWRDIV